MIKKFKYFKLNEQYSSKGNPINKLKDGISITVRDVDNYLKELKEELKEKTKLDNMDDILELDFTIDTPGDLIQEYEEMSSFLDDLLRYGEYDSEIIDDEIFEEEMKDLIQIEKESLNIPDWLVIDEESTLNKLENTYSIVEYKNYNFYIR